MDYIIEHTGLWFSLAEIPALLVLIAVIVIFVLKDRKMKKEIKELEEQLTKKYEDNAKVNPGA